MFRHFSIQWWKFWRAGEGISVKTGRAIALYALVGVLSGFAAVAFYWMLDVSRHLLTERIGGLAPLLAAGEPSLHPADDLDGTEPVRWVLLFLPVFGAVAGALLVKFFAPEAGGHGTDACIFAYHRKAGNVSPGVIPVKALSAALVIGSGGSAGSEGPITQIGAGCGSLLAKLFRLAPAERRILMAAGLSSGVGAIFRAPLAGALFGAEIFYSGLDIEYEVVMPSIIASTVSYTIFSLFYGWQPLFAMPEWGFDSPAKLLLFLALAVIVSLGAKLYILVFRKTEQLFRGWNVPDWVKPGIGGLLTGILGFFSPNILGAGYGLIQQALAVDSPLVEKFGVLSLTALLLIFIAKIFATSFSVGSGGSGGLFGPALVAGSALGAASGLILRDLFPTLDVHPGAFALVGMAGFLAASVRTPIAAIIMVSEISGNHELLLPTMWVCGICYWLGNGWTIYRSQVRDRDCSPAHVFH